MSKIHKHAKISRIRNTGKTFKKCLLKLILYVLNSKNLHNETIYTKFREMYWYLKNLHNETISRNYLYEISRN
jgi:hypothetical protein